MAYLRTSFFIKIGFGAISLIAGLLLKFFPCGKENEELSNGSRVMPESSESSLVNVVGAMDTTKKQSLDETGQFIVPDIAVVKMPE